MMRFTEKSVAEFTASLAAKTPVPGGGGASALAGALGAALGSMVASFAIGKPEHAAEAKTLTYLQKTAETLQKALTACVDADAAAYLALAEADCLPEDTPNREALVETRLAEAAAVPMKVMELCCEAISLHRVLSETGSKTMLSDVGTGAALCQSALCAAALQVKSNTKQMKNREKAERLNHRVETLLQTNRKLADEIYQSVFEGCS